jgi:ABC-type transport system substrate-binding protein
MFLKLQTKPRATSPLTQSASALVSIVMMFGLAFGGVACTKKVSDTDTTINAVLKANVKGLDPIRASDLYSSTVIAQMFEGLLQYHYLKRPYEIIPALADGMPVVSNKGLTYTFKLKKGVKFHDNPCFAGGKGREVTAEDFVYSFKRLADPRNTSDGFWIFDGQIKGLNEWADAVKAEKANYDTPVEGLKATDKYTLVMKLTKPFYQLNYVLAMQYASVVPREAIEKYAGDFINNPVGTGPFMLEKPSDWVRNSKITLKKNPIWRGEAYPTEGEPGDKEAGLLADAGKPMPFAEQLVFTELPEDQPRWQNLVKGNFDFAEIPNDNFETAVKDNKVSPDFAAKGMRLDIMPNVDVTYIGLNMNDPLLGKNKELRHALALAQDNATLIKKFYNGRGIIAQGPIPPGLSSYDEKFKNPYQQFSVEKAKEALKKAGYPDGKGLPEFVYEGLSDSKDRQQAEFFAQNMAAIGVKIKINANTWPQFQDKIKNGRAQIFGIAWGADYPDAQNFYQLFYSKNVSPGPNDTSFSNAEFDKLYEKSLTLPPGKERDEVYQKMRDIVVEESPWMLSAHRVGYRLVHGWVQNFKWNEIQNDYFKYLRIDAKKRAELKAKL